MRRHRSDKADELLAKILWEPLGWNQGARTRFGIGMDATARREVQRFKARARAELEAMTAPAHAVA
jgi:hypothetical protein